MDCPRAEKVEEIPNKGSAAIVAQAAVALCRNCRRLMDAESLIVEPN
jgi:hypothetical protein